MDYSGLISIFGGIYGFLLANGTLPKEPKDPAKLEQWRNKYGKMLKILCPFIIVFGFCELFGLFSHSV